METPERKNNTIRDKVDQMVYRHRNSILEAIRQNETRQLQGDDVFCPVCSSSFSSFAPLYKWHTDGLSGDHSLEKTEENKRCPNCHSLQRQRMLWMFLHQKTTLLDMKPKSLLEVAPDLPFFDLFSNQPRIDYHPVDLMPQQWKYSGFPSPVAEADICHLNHPDNSFDVILCSHVLEHVPQDRQALLELHRVLKPGGWAIIQVPVHYNLEVTYEDPAITSPEEREKAFGQKDHCRRYGRDYAKILFNAGFKVTVIDFFREFSEAEAAFYGLDPWEKIHLCSK
jgi:hypothetical protein